MMTPDLLQRAGAFLYGDRWKAMLSRDLGCSDRTLRRWMAGKPMPAGTLEKVRAILAKHRRALDAIEDALEAAIEPVAA